MWIPAWVRAILSAEQMRQLLPPQMWMTDRELTELAQNMEGFEAHNVEFERAIWHHIMHRRYGFPDLVLEKCHCTAARAAIQSLPRRLEKVGQILGLTQQKDADGHRAMLRVCKPRAPRKDEKEAFPDWENRVFWEESPEYLSTVIKYCAQDIRTEVDLSNHLQDISPNERKIWLIDQKINQRGFFCDAVGAQAMLEMVAEEKRLLEQEFRRDISGDAWNPNQTAKLREWLASRGVPVDDVAKGTMTETLEEMDLPDDVRRAIEIRLDFSKTSTAKYQALLRRRSLDGRVRSTTLYHGAGTGRWSGKAFQPHNLPSRNLTPQSELCIDLVTACPDPRAVRTLFGSPMKAASSCIRPMLMAPPGMDLLWADYNAVEGRALAWLAGEEHVLRAYREKQDLYKVAAGHAFGVDPLSIDKEDPRRQIGKVIELACLEEFQLVTTHVGLVPIKDVKPWHLVFDGIDFVKHGGVVYRGIKEVITYDGLTATPDHTVFCGAEENLKEMSFADAAQGKSRLFSPLSSGNRVGPGESHIPGDSVYERVVNRAYTGGVPDLRGDEVVSPGRIAAGKNQRVLPLLPPGSSAISKLALQKNNFGEVPLRKPQRPRVQALRGPGGEVPFQKPNRSMSTHAHSPESARPENGNRPDQQQPRIPSGQYAILHPKGKSSQSTEYAHPVFQAGGVALFSQRGSPENKARSNQGTDTGRRPEGSCREEKKLAGDRRQAKVYDILNCGPRNRFVVSGVLVHNCGYQGWVGAYEAMARTYGMKPLPEEQTKDLLLAWRESRPATTRLWRELESAAISAVKNPGQICRYRMIQMLFHGDYLRVRLPSGRLLWYYHPVVKLSQTPWGQEKDMLWYMGEDSMTKQWRLISMYGGKFSENCISGGQLVTTDAGPVPIEEVKPSHLVFDGEEFVKHGGVVCRGMQDVVTYGGLTATVDHRVFVKGVNGILPEPWAFMWATVGNKRLFRPDQKMQEPYDFSSGRSPVYDILNCGPRNRFVVSGVLVHNCTQAVCRDLMAEAILRAEAQRYWVVMHVHDEIITEIPEGWGDLAHFENLMSIIPNWAPGLPITAKGFRAKRYQKK